MTEVSNVPRNRRLNPRNALCVTVLVLVVVPGLFVLKSYRERKGRGLFLEEARRRIERKQRTWHSAT